MKISRADRVLIMNIVLAHSGVNPASFAHHRKCDLVRSECPDYAFRSYLQVYASLSMEERERAQAVSWMGGAA